MFSIFVKIYTLNAYNKITKLRFFVITTSTTYNEPRGILLCISVETIQFYPHKLGNSTWNSVIFMIPDQIEL